VGLDPQSLRISAFVSASSSARPILEASLTLGSPQDLAATSDEVDPNPAVKQGRSAFPAIDRSSKGDPFIIFRPVFQAKRAPQPARAKPTRLRIGR